MVFQAFSFTQITHHNPLYTFPLTHTFHLSQPSGCVFEHPSNVWWVEIIKAPHYAVFSTPLLQINQSFDHSVYQSIRTNHIFELFAPFWDGLEFKSYVQFATEGTEIRCWGFHRVLLPEQMLIKTNISGTSGYSQSSTVWCFPGCDTMWFGRLLDTVPVCRYLCLCPRSQKWWHSPDISRSSWPSYQGHPVVLGVL